MTTDFRALCAELHAALEKHDISLADDRLLDRSAAALRAARRLKPPSLKAQAFEILDDIDAQLDAVHYNILRRALEQLDE